MVLVFLFQCDARFGAKETLNRHMHTHKTAKPYTCTECGKGFIQLTQLKTHMIQHQSNQALLRQCNSNSNYEIYRCVLCDRSYRQRWRLQHHYRIEHNEHKEVPELPEVLDSSPGKSIVLAHLYPSLFTMTCQSAATGYNCDVCGKNFGLKQSLKVHFLTHVRVCNQCRHGFHVTILISLILLI